MTLSPDFSTRMVCLVPRYCSAIRGLTLDLMPPVPRPMIIIAVIKPPRAAPCSIDVGREVINRINMPNM